MLEFNLQGLSNPQEKEYLITKPCKILECFSFDAAISTPPAFIVSYLKPSLCCSVYVHLHLFLTKNKLKSTLKYDISPEYHKTA